MIPTWMTPPSALWTLGFTDLGAGVVDSSLDYPYADMNFARSTVAAARLSTGLWNLGVAIDAPRSHYLADGSYGGYLSERAATQLALNPRDLTQAAWVKTDVTAAKTSTGIDGVTNSCSRLTCDVDGGSVLQTVTAAASTRTFSAYVKRVSGTGTVTLNHLNASLDITALINSTTYTLVQLSASKLNATLGFTFATAGDAIDVDCTQFEAGTFATTPIPAAGTRGFDQMFVTQNFPEDALPAASFRCIFSVEFATAPADAMVLSIRDADTPHVLFPMGYVPSGLASTNIKATDNTNTPALNVVDARNVLVPYGVSFGADFNITEGSNASTTAYNPVMLVDSVQNIEIGIGCDHGTDGADGVGKELCGTIKELKFWNVQLPVSYLSAITQ